MTKLTIGNSVTEIGNGVFSFCSGLTEVTVPNSVTKIDDNAFMGCTGLTRITIGNSVTSIGKSAFDSCVELTEVTIPNSVTLIGQGAFQYCAGLKGMTFPNSVNEIGTFAFRYCSNLMEVIIPNSISEIGPYAFDECPNLVKSAYPNNISNPFVNGTAIAYPSDGLVEAGVIWNIDKTKLYFVSLSYKGDFNIPNTVISVGEKAFIDCTGLMGVSLGNSVKDIGPNAFENCTSLKWIESQSIIPPTIYSNKFSDYSVPLFAANEDYKTADYWRNFSKTFIASSYTPTDITFEVDGLKYEVISVKDLTCRLYAIDESVTGENVVIPESVVYRDRTFKTIEIKGVLIRGVSAVKEISIPRSTTTISSGIIINSSIEKFTVNTSVINNPAYLTSIDELVISSDVNEFSADLSTDSIGKITIEDGETALTTAQFKCDSLKEVYMGRCVSASTFKGLTSLNTVTISDKVTSIDDTVFSGCKGIRTVISHNTTPPVASDPFSNETYFDGVLYVPKSSIEAYQAASGWKNFWEVKPLSELNGIDDIVVDDEVVTVEKGVISVSGDKLVRIVAVSGATVYSGRGEIRVNVAPGIYIVVVGSKAGKVVVR
jgi:hypothetical protein